MQLKPYLPALPSSVFEGVTIYEPLPDAREKVPIAHDLLIAAEEVRDASSQDTRWV